MSRLTAALAVAALVAASLTVGVVLWLREPGGDDPTVRPTQTAGPSVETLDEQVERIARTVEEIRGLAFVEIPEPTTITPDELADRVAEELRSYTDEDAASDERILQALGAIDAETDLRTLIIRGYSEQVGGFYDPSTGELVVGAEDPSQRLGRLEEIILAHELEHALTDVALGLPDLEDVADGEEDRALAAQALIEGSATVTMQRYVEVGFSVVDQLLLPGELADLEAQLAGFTELPHYVQRSFTFPYEEGAAFVQHLLAEGGWRAVDEAYDEPPQTTAEIIFPDRYPASSPPGLPEAASPGEEWELDRVAAFGAADLLFLLEAPGDDPDAALDDPRQIVGDWQAGRLALHTDGDRSAVAVTVVGSDGSALCPAVDGWYDAAHGDDEREGTSDGATWDGGTWEAVLVCDGATVTLGIGPSLEVARALVGR